jgi:Cof subfamily protein (haloacid dehalogenase superfamily)
MNRLLEAVVSDLDGSFLNPEDVPDSEDINTVKTLLSRGIDFYIATGRHPTMVRQLLPVLGITTPLICLNGAGIYDFGSEEYSFIEPMPQKETEEICSFLYESNTNFVLYLPDEILLLGNWGKKNYYESLFARNKIPDRLRYQKYYQGEYPALDILIPPEARAETGKQEFQKRLMTWLLLHPNLGFTPSSQDCFEIGSAKSSKGNALQLLSKKRKFELSKTLVLGDSYNDLSMLTICGYPYVPENSELVFLSGYENHLTAPCGKAPLSKAVKLCCGT